MVTVRMVGCKRLLWLLVCYSSVLLILLTLLENYFVQDLDVQGFKYKLKHKWFWKRNWKRIMGAFSRYDGQYLRNTNSSTEEISDMKISVKTSEGGYGLKNIVIYTPLFNSGWGGFYDAAMGECPDEARCRFTTLSDTRDAKNLSDAMLRADAVLFHLGEMKDWVRADVKRANTWRKQHQRYIMFTLETPLKMRHDVDYEIFDGFFNWTMTYRMDSDVYAPYGQIVPKTNPSKIPHKVPTRQKNDTAFWIVSNCNAPSDRDDYVRELRRHGVEIDIFGKCGKQGRRCRNEECGMQKLHKSYWFYLSFENAVCDDYVTEKFFNAADLEVVPVVLGGANYSNLFPPKSFIDAQGFASPKELADYLNHLQENQDEYQEYFQWRGQYDVIQKTWRNVGGCALCKMLHDDTLPDKNYLDIWQWYSHKDVTKICREAGTFPWSFG